MPGRAAGQRAVRHRRVDPLRVYVSVPQTYAPAIKNGMEAWVTLQEFPGQKFKGTVARTAEAIDPTTRTLLTEVDVPNKDGTPACPARSAKCISSRASTRRKSPSRSMPCCSARKARGSPSSAATAKCSCGPSPLAATTARRWRSSAASSVERSRHRQSRRLMEEGQQVNVAPRQPGRQSVMKRLHPGGRHRRQRFAGGMHGRTELSASARSRLPRPTRRKARGASRRPRTRFPKARGGRSSTMPS